MPHSAAKVLVNLESSASNRGNRTKLILYSKERNEDRIARSFSIIDLEERVYIASKQRCKRSQTLRFDLLLETAT